MDKWFSSFLEQAILKRTLIAGGSIWVFLQIMEFLFVRFHWNENYLSPMTLVGFGSVPAIYFFLLWKSSPGRSPGYLIGIALNVIVVGLILIQFNPSRSEAQKSITAGSEHIPTSGAVEWYLKGKLRLNPENKEDVDSCIFFFSKAILIDSLYAEAYAQLSYAYAIKNYWIRPSKELREKSVLLSRKALLLNPDLADGHFAHAYSIWNFDNRFPHEVTIRELKRAISINPKLAEAYHQLGVVYMHLGLYEKGGKLLNTAAELEPDDNWIRGDNAGLRNYTMDTASYRKNLESIKRLPERLIAPRHIAGIAKAYLTLGMNNEAERLLIPALEKYPKDELLLSLQAISLAKKGDFKTCRQILHSIDTSSVNKFGHFHHTGHFMGIAYAIMGENEKAVQKIAWSAENGFPSYTLFASDPLLKPLQDYKPFENFLHRLKIECDRYEELANEPF